MKENILFISTAIVPILMLILSIFSFWQSRKSDAVGKQIQQANVHGDNYYVEDNRSINVQLSVNQLVDQQATLETRRENIAYIDKLLQKISPYVLLGIYILITWPIMVPFPDAPLISIDINEPTLVSHFIQSIYLGMINMTQYLVLFVALLCFALFLKKLLFSKRNFFIRIFNPIYYLAAGLFYMVLFYTLENMPRSNLKFATPDTTYSNFNDIIVNNMNFFAMLIFIGTAFVMFYLMHLSMEEPLDFSKLKNLLPRLCALLFVLVMPLLFTVIIPT
ncbi:hypothetical protein [Listeria booriae]|uniref:hypothetical protein n=1 Tax=Listeria booriae TaxID=1552123 RepID=UPI001E2A5FD3|nr:hypothetical protein [Listeria booriae]MCD2208605.1 hypothetical protein [Listeria booriae]